MSGIHDGVKMGNVTPVKGRREPKTTPVPNAQKPLSPLLSKYAAI
jgi:hypothetical protein